MSRQVGLILLQTAKTSRSQIASADLTKQVEDLKKKLEAKNRDYGRPLSVPCPVPLAQFLCRHLEEAGGAEPTGVRPPRNRVQHQDRLDLRQAQGLNLSVVGVAVDLDTDYHACNISSSSNNVMYSCRQQKAAHENTRILAMIPCRSAVRPPCQCRCRSQTGQQPTSPRPLQQSVHSCLAATHPYIH